MEVQVQDNFFKFSFSRRIIFDIWNSKEGNETEKFHQVLDTLIETAQLSDNIENIKLETLSVRIRNLCKRISSYWAKVHRTKAKLLEKYSDWLGVIEHIDVKRSIEQCISQQQIDEVVDPSPSTSRSQGRPRKDFNESSKRTKRRRLAELTNVDSSTVNTLLNASADTSLTSSTIDVNDVLSLIAEAKLTRHQYLLVKKLIDKISKNILPSYQSIVKAKEQCYPPAIAVTESSAEVELQSLLDHTATRILESQKDILDRVPTQSLNKISLIGKWGFDGSTGHSEYKQRFPNSSGQDSSLFVTSYVPLHLILTPDNEEDPTVLWKNPRRSSTRYCRPIRFQFLKESSAVSVEEETYFKQKISNLQPTIFKTNDREYTITHNLQLTMVDGKVCNALSNVSATKCYICNALPSEMNKIDLCLCKAIDESKCEYGLSPLHAYIRFFEYFIHVAYKLEVKKWQARSDSDKKLVAEKKQHIQTQFRERLGLIVDKPKSGGSGSSNDGSSITIIREYTITHNLQLTMVDGKVCNALSNVSATKCYICNALPSEMNKIDLCLCKAIDESKCEYGLSPLHAYIRFFEYFIHVAYKLEVKKWQARSDSDKKLVAEKKQHIQTQFRERLGLIVDKPKSGGSGSSNDGNTARRFFSNSEISADITGIKKDLLDRCWTILQCLNSGYNIDKTRFRDFAIETARQLVAEYPWYNMPASVHKVLIHGANVIDYGLLSIGELSEEAAEATNKFIKSFRQNNTRKMNRVLTNTDLINRLLLHSDPLISGLRRLPVKKKTALSKSVLDLLCVK